MKGHTRATKKKNEKKENKKEEEEEEERRRSVSLVRKKAQTRNKYNTEALGRKG